MSSRLAILLTLVASVLVVSLIGIWAKAKRSYSNGFNRLFLTQSILSPRDTVTLNNSFYFAGNTDHTVYMGSITGPRSLLQVNIENLDTQRIVYFISERKKFIISQIRVFVDSPNFFMADGTVPVIYKGNTQRRIAYPFVTEGEFFIDYTPLKDSSFLIVSINRARERMLGKMDGNGKAIFMETILEKQIDGFFCTAGKTIVADGLVGYMYSYRNEFIIADSDLKVQSRLKTIDTISRVRIGVSVSDQDHSSSLATPPRIVNKNAAIHKNKNLLFINSLLISDNESQLQFKTSSVIDVYGLSDRRYKFSFYIPNYNNENLKDFEISGDIIIALYNTTLVTFKLNDFNFENNTLHADQDRKTEHL
jgi:hypothetical protein